MVKQAGRKSGGGSARRKTPEVTENGRKKELRFVSSAKRALMIRRFWLFLLTAALVLIGLASVVGARFF
jgi:hypothetical protein